MRIALKNTILTLLVYLLGLLAIGYWLNSELRSTVRTMMERTAYLIAEELEAALHDPIVDGLLHGDLESRTELRGIVDTAAARSDTLTSILVIDRTGKVIASDDESMSGQLFSPAESIFSNTVEPRYDSTFDRTFGPGVHRILFPLVRNNRLLGYLSMTLSNGPIDSLFERMHTHMLLIAALGPMVIIGLGLLLKRELTGISNGLGLLLDSGNDGTPAESALLHKDEFRDVRKAAVNINRELRQARDRAADTERELDMLSRTVEIGVMLIGPEQELMFANQTAEELVSGNHKESFNPCFEELKNNLSEAVESLRNKDVLTQRADVELNAGGVMRRLRVELHTLDTDKWRGCMLLLRDLGRVEALDKDLRAATHYRGLASLYAGAAHDLKAPFHAMLMNLEVLKLTLERAGELPDSDTEFQSKSLHYIEVVVKELERLNRFLNLLLSQTAPSADSGQRFHIEEVVRELITFLEPQAHLLGIDVELDFNDSPLVTVGNSGEIKQALLNILLNAIEAMPDSGKLRVHGERRRNTLAVSICDTGAGIPSTLQDKVFAMHFTTKDTGTGIGLYVSRSVIHRHGGEIRIDTRLGEGTCVVVTLPAVVPG